MIKTKEQFKKAVIKHHVLASLIGLAFVGGIAVSGVVANKYGKDTSSVIESSQEYKDYFNQTQKDLLENGKITDSQYQENVEKGPEYTNQDYALYINKAGTREEIEEYYNLEKKYMFALTGAMFCTALLPIHLLLSSFRKQSIRRDYASNKEEIELIDDNDKNQL